MRPVRIFYIRVKRNLYHGPEKEDSEMSCDNKANRRLDWHPMTREKSRRLSTVRISNLTFVMFRAGSVTLKNW